MTNVISRMSKQLAQLMNTIAFGHVTEAFSPGPVPPDQHDVARLDQVATSGLHRRVTYNNDGSCMIVALLDITLLLYKDRLLTALIVVTVLNRYHNDYCIYQFLWSQSVTPGRVRVIIWVKRKLKATSVSLICRCCICQCIALFTS